MAEKKKRHTINPSVHYVTLAALLISNLSVLTLGFLFSTQLGQSMGSIASIGYQLQIEKTQAAIKRCLDCGGGAPGGPSVPYAPTNLSAVSLSMSTMKLMWNDNSMNELGFKIERKLASDVIWGEIATMTSTSTFTGALSYWDLGLTASTTYAYRLRAYNAVGNSGYSNLAEASTLSSDLDTIPPSTPLGLMVDHPCFYDPNLANVYWNASTDNPGGSGVSFYDIYRNNSYLNSIMPQANFNMVFYIDRFSGPSNNVYYEVDAHDYRNNVSNRSERAFLPLCP